MKKKRASEIFGIVDPHLRVIDGGTHYRSPRENRLTSFDWDKAGGISCPSCNEEVVRLIDGLCPQCHGVAEENIAKKMQDKSERRYYKGQIRKGTISLAQMREGRLGS